MRLFAAMLMSAALIGPAVAEGLNPNQQRAFDIYKELIEINTDDGDRRHRQGGRSHGRTAYARAAFRTPMSTHSRRHRARATWSRG